MGREQAALNLRCFTRYCDQLFKPHQFFLAAHHQQPIAQHQPHFSRGIAVNLPIALDRHHRRPRMMANIALRQGFVQNGSAIAEGIPVIFQPEITVSKSTTPQ